MLPANDQTLQQIVDIVVRAVSPVQVILFGSRVGGRAHEASDYDLLVVKDDVANERLVSRKIHRALFEAGVKVPVDVIVVDRAKFASLRNHLGTVYHWGAAEGKVIYG